MTSLTVHHCKKSLTQKDFFQADNYRLRLGTYSGTAGDSMNFSTNYSHLDMPFSTYDMDNDRYDSGDCSESSGGKGGWWFNKCVGANLNGLNYADGKATTDWNGILWNHVTTSKRSLKTVTMSVRPNNV